MRLTEDTVVNCNILNILYFKNGDQKLEKVEEALHMLQTLPYFYTSFSELWVIARGYRSERNSGGSVLGAGHRDRLAQGSPGPVREDSASLCPALS